MWNRLRQWLRPKLSLSEDEWIAVLQAELARRGLYSSSNVVSTGTRDVTVLYLWADGKRKIH